MAATTAPASLEATKKEEEGSPRSPISKYLHDVGERQREAIDRIYHNTLDGSCLPSCGDDLEDQMDMLMRCRQPLDFFPFFEETRDFSEVDDDVTHVGAYVAPRSCEYCGAPTVSLCSSSCQRPKLYFRKKRPPFCPPGEKWDPETDYEVKVKEEQIVETTPKIEADEGKRSSWVSGFFGGNKSTTS